MSIKLLLRGVSLVFFSAIFLQNAHAVDQMQVEDDLETFYKAQCSAYQVIKNNPPTDNSLNRKFYNCNDKSYDLQQSLIKYYTGTVTETLDGPNYLIIKSQALSAFLDVDPARKYSANPANKGGIAGKRHVKTEVALLRQTDTPSPTHLIYDIYEGMEKRGSLQISVQEKGKIMIDHIEIEEEFQGNGIGFSALQTFLAFIDSNPKLYSTISSFFLRDTAEINGKEAKGIYETFGFKKLEYSHNGYERKRCLLK